VAIAKEYMSPNLRWGLFVMDNPGAPEPTYEILSAQQVDVPADFCFDDTGGAVTQFVRCTLRRPDGTVISTGDKEIPVQEKRTTGQVVTFRRTAENWRKLRTMSLGRALKAAGYPDMSTDLRTFLTYRHRLVEMGLGGDVRALGAGIASQLASTLPAVTAREPVAAKDDAVPHDPETGELVSGDVDDDVAEGALVEESLRADEDPGEFDPDDETGSIEPVTYPQELEGAAQQLSPQERQELMTWMEATGYPPKVLHDRAAALKAAVKKCHAIAAKSQAAAS